MEQRSGSASPSSLAFSFCRETETVSEIQRRQEEGPHKERIQDVGISPTVKDTLAALQVLISTRILSGYLAKSNQTKEATRLSLSLLCQSQEVQDDWHIPNSPQSSTRAFQSHRSKAASASQPTLIPLAQSWDSKKSKTCTFFCFCF